ncbi:MAG: SRPBCC family protein [Methanobacteriota archaeon]
MASEGTFVDLTIRRDFPHPLPDTFAWLTDYQDDDPSRTDAVIKRRPVVERGDNRYVLDGELEVLGMRPKARVEVTLYPPDHYEARVIEGSGRGTVYLYDLAPTPTGTRLTVRYRFRVRRLKSKIRLWLYRPLIRRELNRMWDGFAQSMAKDLNRAG